MNKQQAIVLFAFLLTLYSCRAIDNQIPGTGKVIKSFFDFSEEKTIKALVEALKADEHGNYDLRPLEELYEKTGTFFQRHRGKIGFCAGMAIWALLSADKVKTRLSSACFYLISKT